MNYREKYDLLLAVQERLVKAGTEKWMQRRLASALMRHFPSHPLRTFEIFTASGWDSSDIFHWLTHALTFRRQNPNWADSFERIFIIEETLQRAGLSRKTAHSLAITQAWLYTISPEILGLSVQTFVFLGYGEDVIKSIANKMPHIFHLPAKEIIQECETATRARRGLLWNTKLPSPFPQISIQALDQTSDAEQATAKNMETNGSNGERAQLLAKQILAQGTAISTGLSEPKPIKKTLPPLKLFTPTLTLQDAQPLPDGTTKTVEIGAETENTPETIYREPNLTEEDAHHSLLDLKILQSIVESAFNGKESAWTKFRAANEWLGYSVSNEYKAFMLFSHWVPLHNQVTPEQLRGETDAGVKARFWQKMLFNSKFKPILQLETQTLELRMYILRRIGREFTEEPEWLLLEWETLNSVELRYRMNEIGAHGKKPHLKPYINMMLVPDRKMFMKRLRNFTTSHRDFLSEFIPDEDIRTDLPKSLRPPGKRLTGDELKTMLLADKKKKKK